MPLFLTKVGKEARDVEKQPTVHDEEVRMEGTTDYRHEKAVPEPKTIVPSHLTLPQKAAQIRPSPLQGQGCASRSPRAAIGLDSPGVKLPFHSRRRRISKAALDPAAPWIGGLLVVGDAAAVAANSHSIAWTSLHWAGSRVSTQWVRIYTLLPLVMRGKWSEARVRRHQIKFLRRCEGEMRSSRVRVLGFLRRSR